MHLNESRCVPVCVSVSVRATGGGALVTLIVVVTKSITAPSHLSSPFSWKRGWEGTSEGKGREVSEESWWRQIATFDSAIWEVVLKSQPYGGPICSYWASLPSVFLFFLCCSLHLSHRNPRRMKRRSSVRRRITERSETIKGLCGCRRVGGLPDFEVYLICCVHTSTLAGGALPAPLHGLVIRAN